MGRQVETIITDQGSSLIAVIKELQEDRKFTGSHYIDVYHLLKLTNIKNQ